jgi:hypothetical protein
MSGPTRKPVPTPPPSQAVVSMRITPAESCLYSSLNPGAVVTAGDAVGRSLRVGEAVTGVVVLAAAAWG